MRSRDLRRRRRRRRRTTRSRTTGPVPSSTLREARPWLRGSTRPLSSAKALRNFPSARRGADEVQLDLTRARPAVAVCGECAWSREGDVERSRTKARDRKIGGGEWPSRQDVSLRGAGAVGAERVDALV